LRRCAAVPRRDLRFGRVLRLLVGLAVQAGDRRLRLLVH
jgi:hypothetical protein